MLSTNFFHLHKRSEGTQRKKQWRPFFIGSIGVLVVVLVLAVLFAIRFERSFRLIYEEATLGREAFGTARAELQKRNLAESVTALTNAATHVHRARAEFLQWKIFFSFPWVGKQLRAVDTLLLTTEDMVVTMRDVVRWAKETSTLIPSRADVTLNTLTKDEKEPVLQILTNALPFWKNVQQRVHESVERLIALPSEELIQPLRQLIGPLQKEARSADHVLKTFVTLIEVLPEFSGYPTEKTYLFLLQNNDELRPTGGFIGTYGIINVDRGELKRFVTHDVYALDSKAVKEKRKLPSPPEPLRAHLGVKQFFFRDANWSPDFRVSAETLLGLYAKEGGTEKHIDGIIAVTPRLIERLLTTFGSLTVDGQTFNAPTFVDVLEYEVEQGFLKKNIPRTERKGLVGKLGNELVARLFTVPLEQWPSLLSIFDEGLQEKQVLLYTTNEQTQHVLEREGWAGEMKQGGPNDDFLFVVDANLASLKTDRVVDRSIDYALTTVQQTNGEGGMVATVKLTYTNRGFFDWRTTRYRTYTRVYVPNGSRLLNTKGAMKTDRSREEGSVETGEDLGKTFFAAFLSVEPGETKTLEFTYLLPKNVFETLREKTYTLFVQKQPGVLETPLTIDLKFDTLFKGFPRTIDQFSPTGFEVKSKKSRQIRFESPFRGDRVYSLTFE